MDPILGVRHAAIRRALPPGACDCHTHVFGPHARFPLDADRRYTPGEASVAALLALQAALGMDRVVIVQPSPYGTDNSCTLDAVRQLGNRARAVAVIDPDLPPDALAALHRSGVRGVRVNLQTAGVADPVRAGQLLQQAAAQVAPLGWHVQTYTSLDVIAALHGRLADLPVPLVIDHFGRAMADKGTGQPGFAELLDLVRTGKAYVKLSAAHRIAPDLDAARLDDARPDAAGPVARALIAANPARMLWGSDWPHPGGDPSTRDPAEVEAFSPIDDGAALNRLLAWVDDDATLAAILVDNPARLYGFG